MKRSQINRAIRRMEELIGENGGHVPPFGNWTPDEWQGKDDRYDEIRDNMLGWDITDFGMGDFDKCGFALFTVRNGNTAMHRKYPKPYAEKLLMLEEGQMAPMHFHWHKMEDIINRGGGNVLITVYMADENEGLSDKDVTVHKDGCTMRVPAGTAVRLTPGESISIQPYLYHRFDVEEGGGAVLLGEVSMCNDDVNDNRFLDGVGRFPAIEEDEAPYRLLCSEYPAAKK